MNNVSEISNLISAGSMGADITGEWQSLAAARGVSVHSDWTGTSPVGVLYIEVANSTSLTAVPARSITVDANTGTDFLNHMELNAAFIRAHYVRASGTGTMNVVMTIKR